MYKFSAQSVNSNTFDTWNLTIIDPCNVIPNDQWDGFIDAFRESLEANPQLNAVIVRVIETNGKTYDIMVFEAALGDGIYEAVTGEVVVDSGLIGIMETKYFDGQKEDGHGWAQVEDHKHVSMKGKHVAMLDYYAIDTNKFS